ncbi:MAG: hypothetical protein U1A27_03830 [Phycisphaerae bacterium]
MALVFPTSPEGGQQSGPGGGGEAYVWDRSTHQSVLVSRSGTATTPSNTANHFPRLSASGRFVAFQYYLHIYLLDRDADGNGILDEPAASQWRLILISTPNTSLGNKASYRPNISSTGRYVTYGSYATNLVPGDTNAPASSTAFGPPLGVGCDVFVQDRDADGNGVFDETAAGGRRTVRVSVNSGGQQTNLNANSQNPDISGDGRFVVYDSDATNLVASDFNGLADVFLHDRDCDANGVFDEPGQIKTIRISVGPGQSDVNGPSRQPVISRDGRFIAFQSTATNILPGAASRLAWCHVYLFDRLTEQMTRVSAPPGGEFANGSSFDASISGDGRFVVFTSLASNLVPGDTNGAPDVFLYDRLAGSAATRLIRVSLTAALTQSQYGGSNGAISADGKVICFASVSANIVAGDTNKVRDLFAYVP